MRSPWQAVTAGEESERGRIEEMAGAGLQIASCAARIVGGDALQESRRKRRAAFDQNFTNAPQLGRGERLQPTLGSHPANVRQRRLRAA
jgi:hypothetical protein